jgi:hypothetical protein
VDVVQQQVEGDGGEEEEDRIDQVGDDADADEDGVRDNVCRSVVSMVITTSKDGRNARD